MARTKDEKLTKARKASILDAAASCFVQHSIHQASMRQICTSSGLSAGAVYNYFPSKDAIIEAIAERERAEIQELNDYLNSSPNCYEAIIQAAKWIVSETSHTEFQLQIELASEANRNKAVKKHLEANDKALFDCLNDTILRGQKDGTICKSLNAEALTKIVMATYEGFLSRIAAEGPMSRNKMVKLTAHTLEEILAP